MHRSLITNALTIDVEDYFQVSAFAPYIPRDQWESRDCRVERNVDRMLQMLDTHATKATFSRLAGLPSVTRNSYGASWRAVMNWRVMVTGTSAPVS